MSLTPCFISSRAAWARPSRARPKIVDFDPARRAIEQTGREEVLELGDDFRNGGLREVQLPGGLGHAAGVDDREKDPQVAELQALADPSSVRLLAIEKFYIDQI